MGQSTAIAARHGRLRASRPGRTALTWIAGTLAVLIVSGGTVVAYAAWDLLRGAAPAVTLAGHDEVPAVEAMTGGINLLLVGSDSRKGQDPNVFGDERVETGELNDVTMLLHVAADRRSASVLSIPRDLFVDVPDCEKTESKAASAAVSGAKINTTLGRGGLSCTVKTVEKLTGLSIPYAAMVQFSGVIALSEAVGGVNVCVAKGISDPYTNTHLSAGMHSLKGMEALQFLRTRHGVGDGSDLGRISNQQVFLSALVRTLKSSDTLGDPGKLYAIAKAAIANMTLSTSLADVTTMVQIAMTLKDIPLENIVFVQYPNRVGNLGKQSGVLPDKAAAAAMMAAISADAPITLTGGTGRGSVAAPADPSGDPGRKPGKHPAAPHSAPSSSGSSGDPKKAAPGDPGTLPGGVLGQSAEEETCSRGQGAK